MKVHAVPATYKPTLIRAPVPWSESVAQAKEVMIRCVLRCLGGWGGVWLCTSSFSHIRSPPPFFSPPLPFPPHTLLPTLSDLHITSPVMQALQRLWLDDYARLRFIDSATICSKGTSTLPVLESLFAQHCQGLYAASFFAYFCCISFSVP